MFRKFSCWFNALMNGKLSIPGLLLFCIDVMSFLFIASRPDYNYPIIIISICDLISIFTYGQWLNDNGEPKASPLNAIETIVIRCLLVLASGILYYIHYQGIVATYIWYVTTVVAVCHAFYCILKTLHLNDSSWLIGTNGKIGVPNWISISRIALSLLVPHIYAVQSFGDSSSLIATILLVIAMITDAVDGFFARRLNAFTKAGKALDPLGDKVIFYPVVIAFMLVTNWTGFQTDELYRIFFYVALGIMAFRDIAFIVWFAIYYSKLRDGAAAGMIDKVRMVLMCVFLGLMAIMMTFPDLRESLVKPTLVAISCVAVFSIMSIVMDYERVMPTIKETEIIKKSSDE